ncbi:MAG TPA: EAL domain-containing protein [Acidobacteriaceae bacterium]|nr:EAL domain-containing protein [Acidobacteriaceae bacterium]
MLASYTALDMAARVGSTEGKAARWWLAGGSFAMGVGIWSMHFIGMLAFRLPVPMGYDPAITVLSLLIAIASSAFALWIVCPRRLSHTRLLIGALVMGSGVCTMHYTGMAAMRMMPPIHYRASLFLLSVLIALVASGVALWIAFHLRSRVAHLRLLRAGASVVMGIAIAGMHYTGMAAAQFPIGTTCATAHSAMNTGWLALLIIVFGGGVLSIALITSVLDLRLELRTAALASSLAQANRELQFLALHDSLTKLPNRALLEDRLGQEIQNARRRKSCFSVLFLDLDGFKQVNDAFGHHIGDLLLVEVAARIYSNIRASDTLARIGGDEFVLLAGVSDPTDAASLADKLVRSIAEPALLAGHELGVSASIGIALCSGGDADSQEILRNADAAMYHAKTMGRNGYAFFDRSMNDDAHRQLNLLHDLRLAQEHGELVLYYQPKFAAADNRFTGAEALLRWNHPTRGLVPPDQFIPLAEKTGLIVPIGAWVVDEACRQMSLWHGAGHPGWSVAVNLSAVQFNHPGLIGMVRDALQRHALDPACLTLEITESTAMRDADSSLVILQQLSDMGVRISIDDFGTGYSSLLYLKRLPASELKIDRGFVRDLDHDTEDAAIISAIVALGRTLRLRIVAEGVETRSQQDFLTQLGCDSLQGYLLGRPVPADQFHAAIAAAETKTSAETQLSA